MDDADRSAEEAPPRVAVAGSTEGPLAAVAADSSHREPTGVLYTGMHRQEHVERLAAELGCELRQAPGREGMHHVEHGFIEGPTIRNQRDYLAILHELGHFACGHTQGRPPNHDETFYFDNGVLRSEAQAWHWAMDRCKEPLEYDSRRFMWDFCLGSYYRGHLLLGTKPHRMGNGNRGHVWFVYDEPDIYFAWIVHRMQGGERGFDVTFQGYRERGSSSSSHSQAEGRESRVLRQ